MLSTRLAVVGVALGFLCCTASCDSAYKDVQLVREVFCSDGQDDDNDGATDCDDDDCESHPDCQSCGDGVWQQNEVCDGDDLGMWDCVSRGFLNGGTLVCRDDCQGFDTGGCETGGEICDNGQDDDGDLLVDCEDNDCQGASACVEVCDDGFDNDDDGRVDCRDIECEFSPHCAEDCNNNVDDDGDGKIDCDDPRCSGDDDC